MELESLTVYINESVWKFSEIDKDYTYHRDPTSGIITIYKRDKTAGKDLPYKSFRNWDYIEWSYK